MFHLAISFIFQNQVHLLYTMHSERQLMYFTTANELSLIGLRLTGPSCDKTTQDSSLHSNWQIDIDMHMYMHKCRAQMKMTYLCLPQEQWQSAIWQNFWGHSTPFKQSKRCFHITCFHTDTVLSGLVSFCLSQVKWRHKGLYLTSLAFWCLLLC